MGNGGWGVLMQWKPYDMDIILYCILHIEYCILNMHTLYYSKCNQSKEAGQDYARPLKTNNCWKYFQQFPTSRYLSS